MKKSTILISMLIIMVILCTSCGTKLPEAGDYTEADNASESAVSDAKNATGTGKKSSINDRYPYCNDRNLYKEGRNNTIKQCRLDGTVVREYTVNTKEEWGIAYVNNEELFYVDGISGIVERQLWRIPIDRREDGDYLQTDKAEKILSGKREGLYCLYANEDYIAYLDAVGRYKEYDRKKNKALAVDREGAGSYTDISSYGEGNLFDYEIAGDTVFLTKRGTGKWKAGTEGIYAHRLGTEQVTKIDDLYVPDDGYMCAVMAGNKFFYSGGWRKNAKGIYTPDDTQDDIWLYDTETKERQKFISTKQLLQCINKKKIDLGRLFIDGDKLYILAGEYNDEYAEDYNVIVFSKDLSGNFPVQCEKKLTKLLNTLDNYKEDGCYFGIDDDEIDFVEGKVIIEYGASGERKRCYDLSKGTDKAVKKDDTEAAYWAYRGNMFSDE